MLKILATSLFIIGSLNLAIPSAIAETAAPSAPKAAKKTVKKKAPAKNAAPAAQPEDDEPDTTGSNSTDYSCELGNKLTIYQNSNDKHIALRWNKRLHRLNRVETTTGAHRYENQKNGLVWIGIPAKGMLLDAQKGKQLANECMNAEQAKPAAPAEGEVSKH